MACGVLGVVLKEGEVRDLRAIARPAMISINHRGENAHGVAFINEDWALEKPRKKLGLVKDTDIFRDAMRGNAMIGHTRYATSSVNDRKHAQPLRFKSKGGTSYAISLNGNLPNVPQDVSDTVALGRMLRPVIDHVATDPERLRFALDEVVGSFSLVILINGSQPKLVALRDKFGYMPLMVGENESGFYVASESIAFGSEYLNAAAREVAPGELVVIDRNGMTSQQLLESTQRQECIFQWIYMLNSVSSMHDRNAYIVREALGAKIAEHYRPEVDFVVPVPDSGRAMANGYANALGMPIREGLIKNRYESRRSFQADGDKKRDKILGKKLTAVPEVVEGMRILLIDDSNVRGNTARDNAAKLRDAGAAEVHMAFACPPIISQCPYGLDWYNEQLLAREHLGTSRIEMGPGWPDARFTEAIAASLHLDSVYFNTIPDLVAAIRLPHEGLCTSCLTGEYVQKVELTTAEERRS